jgi:hypothetical protein
MAAIGGFAIRLQLAQLPPVSQDSRTAAFDFSAAQAVASMAE